MKHGNDYNTCTLFRLAAKHPDYKSNPGVNWGRGGGLVV